MSKKPDEDLFSDAFNEEEKPSVPGTDEVTDKEEELEEEVLDESDVEEAPQPEDPEESGETEGEEQEPSADDKDAEESSDKPDNVWEGADPRLLAEFENLKKERELWEHKYRSNEGRFNAAQRLLQGKPVAEEKPIPTQEDVLEAFQNSENWQKFQSDYPDISNILQAQSQLLREQFDNQIKSIKQETIREIQPSISHLEREEFRRRQAAEIQELSRMHPDWQDINANPDFHAWVDNQPPKVKEALSTYSAAENAAVISSFKNARRVAELEAQMNALRVEQEQQTQRKKKLDKARTVAPTETSAMPRGSGAQGFSEVFNAIT